MQKAYARMARQPHEMLGIFNITYYVGDSISNNLPIAFIVNDLEGVHLPHDGTTVVTMKVANHMLVDNGTSVDVIFANAFTQLKCSTNKLKPMTSSLFGFFGSNVFFR